MINYWPKLSHVLFYFLSFLPSLISFAALAMYMSHAWFSFMYVSHAWLAFWMPWFNVLLAEIAWVLGFKIS